ncbi:MAG: hypothetical protein WDZ56_00660 [Candidatus Paceibacterota bacterium]
MRSAYALLGLSFIIVFLAAYLLIEQAEAPEDVSEMTPEAVNN